MVGGELDGFGHFLRVVATLKLMLRTLAPFCVGKVDSTEDIENKPLPSARNAFRGMIRAVGATRWTMPATIVPWPKAAYCGCEEVSARPWVEDGGSGLIDHHRRGIEPVGGLVDIGKLGARAGGIASEIVTRDKDALKHGRVGSTPVSIMATMPAPETLKADCVPGKRIIVLAGWAT